MAVPDYFDFAHTNVWGIYGHLGGGKTLTAVEIMVEALRLGYSVTSNVALRSIDSLPGKYSLLEDFHGVDFWSLPVGAPRGSDSPFRSIICIDEAAEFLDQYSSSSPVTKSFLSWLRHSSKRGQHVLLIVQRPEFLVKSARLLVNRWIMCDDLAQWRSPIIKMPIPFCSGYVRRVSYDRMGNQVSTGMALASKRAIGQYYDTAQSIATAGRQSVALDYTPPRDRLDPYLVIIVLTWFGLMLWLR